MSSTFVSGFKVVYGDEPNSKPSNVITDVSGNGEDINKYYAGRYVWIVPITTDAGNAACTGFKVDIQSDANPNYDNLAEGTDGDHRYLIPIIDCTTNKKITEIRLMRSSSSVSKLPSGYSGMTSDINAGRYKKSDYLYVIWKTTEFDTTTLSDGVYVISNRGTGTVVDLLGGYVENGTKIQGWANSPTNYGHFNQTWCIKQNPGQRCYTIRNIRSNVCMDLAGGSAADGTPVHGYEANDSDAQNWYIEGNNQTGYSIFNRGSNTALDLYTSNSENGTPIIGYKSHGGANQLWFFERRSRSVTEVRTILQASQTQAFSSYSVEKLCIICPQEVIDTVWRNQGLQNRESRPELYDSDYFAFQMKGAMCDWVQDNLRAPVGLLFGVMFGENNNGEKHAYNWSLNQDLTAVTFFEPQNGLVSTTSDYVAYFIVY
ncbi:carbohydrate-binding module family 13 protein [Serendipita vermifera MAFF 305830]|uniref:Carbohydrate-binding module family 13 protein n=1 Tax=Serendipita vermifera MAFF 305830 TaxID=933852 RepID=A0A0C2WFZ8_SERVB|nr:carbohydrate-binding module family 13 protein [Serendipita vermifera MAFF 305830]